jgi:phosphatidylinositol alpha-mannosyltransferase
MMKSVAGDIDVLHVHEPLMPTVSLSALRVGVPVVATFHAAPSEIGTRLYNLLGGWLPRVLGRHVRRVSAVSATARAPLPVDLDVAIIPNGVDVASLRRDVERNPRLVAFLGRDEPRKGLDVLLKAWPAILDEVPAAELTVMGSERDVPGIEWLGRVDNETKIDVLNSSAIYVAPNTGGESFGIVLVEAMAAGAAVVASNLKAFIDVSGHAAQFFETGNASELASEVVQLLQHDDIRSGLAAAGQARVTDFDWDLVSVAYRVLYEESLS